MDIICKTDVKDILTVGDVFDNHSGVKGIITRTGENDLDYLDISSKVYAGKVINVTYESFAKNDCRVLGNILNAKILHYNKLGSFIPKFYKCNGGNFAGSIVLTTAGRLAFVVRSDSRRNYCELIYLEPPVDDKVSNVTTMKYFYSDTDFIYRLASYRDYSLVLL